MAAEAFKGTIHYNLLKYDQTARAWKRIPQSRPLNFSDVKGNYAKDGITNQEGMTIQTYAEIANIKLQKTAAGNVGVDTSMLRSASAGRRRTTFS